MTSAEEFFPSELPYSPAVFKHLSCHGWVLEYYAYNPITGTKERVRMNMNQVKKRFRTTMEFRAYASKIVCAINAKLFSGWTPFMETASSRQFVTVAEVMEKYIKEKTRGEQRMVGWYADQLHISSAYLNRICRVMIGKSPLFMLLVGTSGDAPLRFFLFFLAYVKKKMYLCTEFMNQLNVPFFGAFFCCIILITHRTIGGMFVPKCDAKVQLIKRKPRQNLPRLQ